MGRTPRSSSGEALASVRQSQRLMPTMGPSDTDMELLSQPLAFQSSPLSLLAHGEPLSPARPQLLRLLRLTTLLPLASVRLTLMPTTVMAAMVGTEPTPLDTGLATAMAVTARDPLTLRLMPTTAMEVMVDTVLATPLDTGLATAMAAMARGLLTLRLMPTMAMEGMVLALFSASGP